MPNVQNIAPRRNVGDTYLSGTVRSSVIGCGHNNYYGTHFRMNVAKNVRYAGVIEANGTSGSCFVESQVKALAFEQ